MRKLALALLLCAACGAPQPQRPEDDGDLAPGVPELLERINASPDSPTLEEALAVRDRELQLPGGNFARKQSALISEPKTIRVWRRRLDGSTSSCSGRVDVIDFETYVKGVLPHEWVPSWDARALRMGALAVRSYAWWWVAAGGKYKCADVDDSSNCQVYADDTYPKTNKAVDDTRGRAIVRNGSIVYAQYSAENGDPTASGVSDPLCAGYATSGHGRGTCQRGTERWATQQGKDEFWMASHYYPDAGIYVPELDADPAPLQFTAEAQDVSSDGGFVDPPTTSAAEQDAHQDSAPAPQEPQQGCSAAPALLPLGLLLLVGLARRRRYFGLPL